MPVFITDGVSIHYEIVGNDGPWIVLTPGGRGSLDNVRDLANSLTKEGYRILLHDRRNCGKSDVYIAGELSEQEVWADDVHALLTELDALPVIAGGGSAGCRLSLLLSLRYPGSTCGLLLWYVTGGQTASTLLGHHYYGQYVGLAQKGGMAAVCESEFFCERIRDNPDNRDRLMDMEPDEFNRVMSLWQRFFTAGAELPVIGAAREALQSIDVPACIIPGSDEVHPLAVARGLNDILPDSEFHYPFPREELAEIKALSPEEIGLRFQQNMAAIFRDFLRRRIKQEWGQSQGSESIEIDSDP